MKLTFIGAAHEVTGSCFYLEACGKHILIDCGMEQGKDIYENQEIPIPIWEIDAVILTHAHIDHSGRLPLLYAQGFRGAIHATSATCSLCNIMLQDSAYIQMQEAEWKNRKGKRTGHTPYVPLYDMNHALGTIQLFVPHEYGEVVHLYDGVQFQFHDVGHLLGSGSIAVTITEHNQTEKIVFSGDIGNLNQPIINNPQYINEADYVVMESTYGDRSHGERPDYIKELSQIIQHTFDKGGNVVIPSFAVGRTQELLYFMHKIKDLNLVKGHGDFNVYVDSPLANEATQIFNDHMTGYFDDEAMELIHQGINPLSFRGLKTSVSTQDSIAINFDKSPKVIISSSGMCEAGRIRHHLKHNLWREECTILFVGYQANGTLGRMLMDGIEEVKLFGETIKVNATIHKLAGISGHADREGLIYWLQQFDTKPKKVFVVHGESDVCDSFAELLKTQFGYDVYAPYSGAIYDLADNKLYKEGVKILIEHTSKPTKTTSTAFERLVNAGKRLMSVIEQNRGGANKDLGKFESQINSLSDKWKR